MVHPTTGEDRHACWFRGPSGVVQSVAGLVGPVSVF